MFNDIGLFEEERQKFYQEIREINTTNCDNPKVRIREANVKFRDNIRKYLPTCLNIINTCYKCQFSIYKIGNDFDSNFRVIQTNVKKTRGEIEIEFTNYENMVDLSSINESDRAKLEKAKEIIITYVDDPTDPNANKSEMLSGMKPVASSIITSTPVMVQKQMEVESEPVNKIQYNPYADKPIDFSSMDTPTVDNSNSLDIFSIGENQTLSNPVNNNIGTFFNQTEFNNGESSNVAYNTSNKFIRFGDVNDTTLDNGLTNDALTVNTFGTANNEMEQIVSSLPSEQSTSRFIDTNTMNQNENVFNQNPFNNLSADALGQVSNNNPADSEMHLGQYENLNIDNSKNLNDLLSPMSEE